MQYQLKQNTITEIVIEGNRFFIKIDHNGTRLIENDLSGVEIIKETSLKSEGNKKGEKENLDNYIKLCNILFNEDECKILLNFAKHKEVYELVSLLGIDYDG